MKRILVIRHGALGDIIQYLGAMQAIRAAHPADHVAALTTAPYAGILNASGLFDAVLIDDKPKTPGGWWRLIRTLRQERFDRVYDLQRKDRSRFIFHGMRAGRALEWSGCVRGASHYAPPGTHDAAHGTAKVAEQLKIAGVAPVPAPDLAFLGGDLGGFALPERFVLLVPGVAASRPRKRWPPAHFAALADRLRAEAWASVAVGGPDDAAACGQAGADLNLCGRTDLGQLAALGRRAAAALGGDTGPMHLLSVAGCPVLTLYGEDSDPARTLPIGQRVATLRADSMAAITPDDAFAALTAML